MASDRPELSEAVNAKREVNWWRLLEEALTVPGRMTDTYSRVYSYSFMNTLLLMMQGVDGPAATYQRWQSVGRQVLKGSKAAAIVRPITVHRKDEEGEIEASFTRFKFVRCVFGYSQTTGDELPPAEPPGWSLERALHNLNVRQVPCRMLDAATQGYSDGREICHQPRGKRSAADHIPRAIARRQRSYRRRTGETVPGAPGSDGV